jgi:hypothetical protein
MEIDATSLFSQVVIDKAQLENQICRVLQTRQQVTLRELCELFPLQHGLAELVAYLQLISVSSTFNGFVDEEATDIISWRRPSSNGEERIKQARLPRVIFVR